MIDVPGQNGHANVSKIFERSPLVDVDLERTILGTCMLRPHMMTDSGLTARDFYGTTHQTIWDAISVVFANEETCDTVRVQSQLADAGKLQSIGGVDYLADITDNILPASSPALPVQRLKRLAIQRRLQKQLVLHANNIHDPVASAHYEQTIAQLHGQLRALDQKTGVTPSHRLDPLLKSVGEWGLMQNQPPPREWILLRPDTETNGMANPIGLLPRSEVGFIVAPGGVGKSFLMIQLGLAVATGRKWLDHFIVPKPGRVLLALGEESTDEMFRRVYQLAQSMRLTNEQLRLVEQNLVLMPLAGELAALVTQDGKSTTETDVLPFLRARMAQQEWALVMLDPMSRFAGADTEKDNNAATRFVQAAETLCRLPGRPTVLFSHHTNKGSRSEDAGKPSSADARGASGITDGGRWCANLTKRPGGGVSLNFTKNNYAADFEETVRLERVFGGYLRVETQESKTRQEDDQARLREAKEREARQKVLTALAVEPGLSKTKLRDRTHLERGVVCDIVDDLVADGLIVESPKHAYRLLLQGGPDE